MSKFNGWRIWWAISEAEALNVIGFNTRLWEKLSRKYPHIGTWYSMKKKQHFRIWRRYCRENKNAGIDQTFDEWLAQHGVKPKERR